MRMLIHDLEEQIFQDLFPQKGEDVMVISNTQKINKCIGCFGCWIKTPTTCVIKDDYKNMGKRISKCNEIIIISRCCYGGFSPFVKNVLDRSIAYLLPYFDIRNNEVHHKSRYIPQIKLIAHFYGENITIDEKNTATELLIANGLNLNSTVNTAIFYDNIQKMRGEIL